MAWYGWFGSAKQLRHVNTTLASGQWLDLDSGSISALTVSPGERRNLNLVATCHSTTGKEKKRKEKKKRSVQMESISREFL